MPRSEPVECWIGCFSGYTQNEGRVTGIDEVHGALRRKCMGPATEVVLKSWRDSPADFAERIWNKRPFLQQPRVVLIGFSYGGYTAVQTARELRIRGIDVDVLLLIDAVWRPGWWASLTSLLHHWEIDIPTNVKTVYRWYQRENYPQGHEIKYDKTTTRLMVDDRISMTHQYIDDADAVYKKAMEVACPGPLLAESFAEISKVRNIEP